jgi:hypothetical protein
MTRCHEDRYSHSDYASIHLVSREDLTSYHSLVPSLVPCNTKCQMIW